MVVIYHILKIKTSSIDHRLHIMIYKTINIIENHMLNKQETVLLVIKYSKHRTITTKKTLTIKFTSLINLKNKKSKTHWLVFTEAKPNCIRKCALCSAF